MKNHNDNTKTIEGASGSLDALVGALHLLEFDHEPDGWPAVQMKSITALLDERKAFRLALTEAIFQTARVSRELVAYDPAGSDYSYDWLPEVKRWADLAGVDLSKSDPFFYIRH